VIIGDFVYGVITKNILDEIIKAAKKHNVKLFGDLQCSSQVGNVSKFRDFNLITPTEREARIALGDTENGLEKIGQDLIGVTNSQNLMITLAENGMVAFQRDQSDKDYITSQFFPALVTNPIDVAGAGDSLLSALSLSLCVENNLMLASIIGSCIAAISVNRVGNIPVKLSELEDYLHHLGKVVGRKNYSFN
ncbi:MAG: ADP-heptose synthase, partial [Nitrospinae bacterium]|nr:ADP-heptose synthase [Nitrospinota bacterium]